MTPPACESSEGPSAVPGRSALLIDCGQETEELLEAVLAGEGWSVQRLSTHEVDVATASRGSDLVVTRWMQQTPENLEELHGIRNLWPWARVIALADKFRLAELLNAVRVGAFSYFSRPIDDEHLVEMVREAMATSGWSDGIQIASERANELELTARCDMETAHRLIEFLRGAKDENIPEVDRESMVTAFREILLNAMEYGGHFDSRQHVEISFTYRDGSITCRLKDPGEGFSMKELGHAAVSSAAGDLWTHAVVREQKGMRPGGFGMLIAKRLVDQLIYNDKGNEVLMVKRIRPEE